MVEHLKETIKPVKPYLIKSLYQWMDDSGLTPYLLIDNSYKNLVVPKFLLAQEELVLNISKQSIVNLDIKDDLISFSARFDKDSFDLFVPIDSVKSIYAQENNEGMWFDTTPQLSKDVAENKVTKKLKLI